MAIAVVGSGTQTAVVSTEHTLDTEIAAKTYVLTVNLSNMAAGDRVELRLKKKVLTGGASAVQYLATFTGDQVEEVVDSIPVLSHFELVATLKQTAGTARTFEWSLTTID